MLIKSSVILRRGRGMIWTDSREEDTRKILLLVKAVHLVDRDQVALSHENSSIKLIKTSLVLQIIDNGRVTILLVRVNRILSGDERQSIEIVGAIITNSIATQINMRMRGEKEIQTKDSMMTSENKQALKSSYVKCKKISRGWKKKQNVSMSKRNSIENNTDSNTGLLIMILSIHPLKTGMLNRK